jgi:hypothetical protein
MSKNSIKWFWVTLFLVAIFVNENLVQWALAVIVGHYSVTNGFKDAFKYFSFGGYAFFTAIRLIPYLILGVIILTIRRKKTAPGIAWGGLSGILVMIVSASWDALHPFYSGEHVSSTTALAFLVIPFMAIVTGIIGALAGWVICFIINKRKKT